MSAAAAHLVLTSYNGSTNLSYEIEFFPNVKRDDFSKQETLTRVVKRYVLTEAQAKLSVEELIVLCAANLLAPYEQKAIVVDPNKAAVETAITKV